MAEDICGRDLDQELGVFVEVSTLQTVREALAAHEGRLVIVEVEAAEQTVVHSSGALHVVPGSVCDVYVGGDPLPSGRLLGFRATVTLPREPQWIARYHNGFRLGLSQSIDSALAIALLPEEG